MPSIFGAQNKGAAQINEVLENEDKLNVEGAQEEENKDLEISDSEMPDVEDAKRNLRSQAEKKRKQKKKVVQGVTQDVEVAMDAAGIAAMN